MTSFFLPSAPRFDFVATSFCFREKTYENEYELKRHILQQSEKIIVVADKNKFNAHPEYTYCKFKEVDVFISNKLTKEEKSQIQVIPKIIEAEV